MVSLQEELPSVARLDSPPPRVLARHKAEAHALVVLAGPLILGFLGNNVLGLVDTAMVGHLGQVDLAAVAVGTGVFFAITCLGIGTILGADPLLAQAIGAGEGARTEATRR